MSSFLRIFWIQCFSLLIMTMAYSAQMRAQCTDNGNYWNDSWRSCTKSTNPNPVHGQSLWIMYEFLESQNIGESHFWNSNRSGQSGDGIKEMQIDYSVDGDSWINLGLYTLDQATETADYSGEAGPDFGGANVKKILITVVSTFDEGPCAALAEISLKTESGICNGTIDECGICDGPGAATWYLDADSDGLGDPSVSINECSQPSGYVSNADDLCDDGTLSWQDMYHIFETSTCTSCHGDNATSGLNLLSYDTFVQGGNNCGSSILLGSKLVDIIETGSVSCDNGVVNAAMNINAGFTVDETELAAIQQWIDSGAPESCTDALACNPGNPCDDNDDCTSNDMLDADCNCAGVLLDNNSNGICDLQEPACNVGEACDDNDNCTTADALDADCNCVGVLLDDNNNGICDLQENASSGTFYDYHEMSECNLDAAEAHVEIYSLYPQETIFYKIFHPDNTLLAQNSSNDYPVLFKRVPFGAYTLSLTKAQEVEVLEMLVDCPEEPAPEPQLCNVYDHYEELSCHNGKARLGVFVNLPDGDPVFHRLYNSSGSLVSQNSTKANPAIFKRLTAGTYELTISYGDCIEVIAVEVSCQ